MRVSNRSACMKSERRRGAGTKQTRAYTSATDMGIIHSSTIEGTCHLTRAEISVSRCCDSVVVATQSLLRLSHCCDSLSPSNDERRALRVESRLTRLINQLPRTASTPTHLFTVVIHVWYQIAASRSFTGILVTLSVFSVSEMSLSSSPL